MKLAEETKKCEKIVFKYLQSLVRENDHYLTDQELDGIGDKAHEWFNALKTQINEKDMNETEKAWFINTTKTKILSDSCREENSYYDKKSYKILLLLMESFY